MACGAPSGSMDGGLPGEGDIGEEPKEWPGEHASCKVQELGDYLYEHTAASPYAGAEIVIKDYEGERLETEWGTPSAFQFEGRADVTWQFYNSLAEMETALNEAAMQETDDNALHFLYYTFPMTENDHALDLYHILVRKYDTEEHPLSAMCVDDGKLFYFMQETWVEEDDYNWYWEQNRNSKVNLYVKDRTAYGMTLLNPPPEDDETLEYVFDDVFQRYGDTGTGWGLDEENLYWIDHEERLTELENPKRSFREIRGIDENWEGRGIMRYFGLLAEADYELPLTEDGRMLSLHFSLAEDDKKVGASVSDCLDDFRRDTIISTISSRTKGENETSVEEEETFAKEEDTELRYFLLGGYCMDEPYDMTVTDMETGEVLQESRVSLSIELPDTITYPDLNGDGYADMRVGAPVHINGAKAIEDDYTPPSYLLWNPLLEQFAYKTEKEVENSRQAVANGLTDEEQEQKTKRERKDPFAPVQELPEWADREDYIKLTGDKMREYEVQEGDNLWRISERFYGTGYKWPTIARAEDAPEDPDVLLAGETVFVPEVFYIRKDPYSRGGLRSEGSFQIEQPDGFHYYFLDDDVTYGWWEGDDENQIHCLPVTNPVGENPFHEPEEWEAFQAEAVRCSEELCPGKVSNLTFEKSHMEDGCELYGYSFEYDTGKEIIEYVDFVTFGRNNMAEVIGVREQEPNTVLVNTVRYMAASFTDYGGKPGMGWGDDTIPNVGADQWEYPYLHNLFEAAKEQFANTSDSVEKSTSESS